MKRSVLCLFPLLGLTTSAFAGWSVSDSNLGTIALGIDFIDESTGYVAGAQNGSGPVVWKSVDGGDSFRVSTDELLSMTYMAVAFGDSDNGVAAGIGMFKMFAPAIVTHDGGRTWKRTANDYSIGAYQDIDAVGADFYAMPGTFATLRSSGDGVAVTRDGGDTWDYYDWGIDTWPRYNDFLTEDLGWIAGGHWSDSAARSESGFWLNEHFAVPLDGRPSPVSRTDASGYRAVVARTTDGGRSYSLQLDVEGVYFNGISFVDAQNGWVVGEGPSNGVIYHTADGGRTWDLQYDEEGASLLNVHMVDAQFGWAVGGDLSAARPTTLVLETSDGGKTWTPQPVNGDIYVFNIDAVDRDHAWAVGYNFSNGQCGMMEYTSAARHSR